MKGHEIDNIDEEYCNENSDNYKIDVDDDQIKKAYSYHPLSKK